MQIIDVSLLLIYKLIRIQRQQIMQSELSRILNSSQSVPLEIELMQSLNQNQHDIQQLEQILMNKNNQIVQLNVMIQHQLNKTMQQNCKLRQLVQEVSQSMKYIKEDIVTYKQKTARIIQQNIIQIKHQIEDGIYDYIMQLQSKNNKKQPCTVEISTQTIQKQSKDDNNELLQKVKGLQNTIQALIQQNERLQRQKAQALHKYKSPISSQIQYNSVQNTSQFQYRIRTHNDNSPLDSAALVQQVNSMSIISQFFTHVRQNSSDLAQLEVKYTGQLVGNVKNGYGICQYKDYFVYQGKWKNGLKHDNNAEIRYIRKQGNISIQMLVYKGKWANGQPQGRGQLYFKDPNLAQQSSPVYDSYSSQHKQVFKYVGHFKNGRPQGYGNIFYTNGDKLRVQIKDGVIIGQALLDGIYQSQNNVHYVDAGLCYEVISMLKICDNN